MLGRQHLLAVRRALVAVAIGAAILCTIGSAKAELPWTCTQIRWAVENLAPAQLEDLARRYGLTAEQRAEVRACLKSRK